MATFIYEFTETRKGKVWINVHSGGDSYEEAEAKMDKVMELLEKDENVRDWLLGKPEIEWEEVMNRVDTCSVNDWNELCEDADLHELKVYQNDEYFFDEVLGVKGRKLIGLVAKSKNYSPDDAYVNVDEDGHLISSDNPMDLVNISDLMPTYEDVVKGAKS